jgi:GSH-dependent disulfide-bond oxidoreductase
MHQLKGGELSTKKFQLLKETGMIELYTTSVVAPVAERVAIMLEECGLEYRTHEIEVGGGAKKPPEFLKINPRGTIPMLVDSERQGGRKIAITQAAAILLYLAEKTGKFLPKDPDHRAIVLQWLMYVVTDAQPLSMSAYMAETAIPEKVFAVVSFFEAAFLEICKIFDDRLAEVEWLGGREISVADIALIPTFEYRRPLIDKAGGFSNLKRWAIDMSARSAVRRILGRQRPLPHPMRDSNIA